MANDPLLAVTVAGIILSLLIPAEAEARFRALFNNAVRRMTWSRTFTIVIQEKERLRLNHMYEACDLYLTSKISDHTFAVKVNKADPDGEELSVTVGTDDEDELIKDVHGGIHFTWVLTNYANMNRPARAKYGRCFQLSVDTLHRDYALKVYLPHVCRKAKEIKAKMKATVRLYTVRCSANYNNKKNNDDDDDDDSNSKSSCWTYAVADHPATIRTMAMDPAVKEELVRDLDLFIKGKDYYRRVGRAWKRGYLFYGPPGTGKSSLIAAMANYLKFDIFDLDLKAVKSNSHLRTLLLSATSRSILVIEDIDCSIISLNREEDQSHHHRDDKITLSGLLNMIDGLWSCCGEGRIIVFTTNHKERLDPALLRPGRMDVQLEMSYCTFPALKMLVLNYMSVYNHPLFLEIEELLTRFPTTPAQIAGVLMKNRGNVDAALLNLVRLLKGKEGITRNI